MRTKNAKPITRAEAAHMAKVKMAPCAVCGAPPPSEAHHPKQGRHFITISLCDECHTGRDGWHGTKARWRLHKMDELDAINQTLRNIA